MNPLFGAEPPASPPSGAVVSDVAAPKRKRSPDRRLLSVTSCCQWHHLRRAGMDTAAPDGSASDDGSLGGYRKAGARGDLTRPSTLKMVEGTVAPFLARHIPEQYAPLGSQSSSSGPMEKDYSNSRYCYRHHPDLKCRRRADEPSMDQLQKELESLSEADQRAISHVWSLFSAAPAKHRQLMLRGILSQCCFPQLSYLSGAVRELVRIDFLSALPPELSLKILCYLDTSSLCKAGQVCRRWKELADDDAVWRRMCEQHIDRKCTNCGWGLPLLEGGRSTASQRGAQRPARASEQVSGSWGLNWNGKRTLLEREGHHGCALAKRLRAGHDPSNQDDENLPQGPVRPWKHVYRDRFKVGTNWKHGRCAIKIFKGHSNGVMCLQTDDEILATGSYDATIKIWDIESGRELRTLRGHTSGVRALQFDDTKLISGSLDQSIKVWNWRTGECLSTYTGHIGGVIGLHFQSSILASGSVDKTIKMWNFEDKSTFTLRGHTDWVNAVRVHAASQTLLSASDDCTVRLWDLESRACLRIFEGHVGQVQQVVPLPPEFEYDEAEATPASIEPSSAAGSSSSSSPSLPPSSSSSSASPLPSLSASSSAGNVPSRVLQAPRYMLTGALDSTVRLWNVASGKCLRTYFGHVEGVWALAADTVRIVSGAEDRMVKVWDARTGRCERTFTGHVAPVTCIGLSDTLMCTGSEDGEVRLYSFRSSAATQNVEGGGDSGDER